ncbi:conjugative transfer relaxase/helicase TraI [Photobacterium phosphoreum]|uniref:conjugative transfer relaxase/helicase TraI n=1 Tax=Photobacterium phosphoreum TaxID=659 RepID=UPI001E3EC25C|nr:conjugative transfer relaxase/helicase TraI [Photobacterium phosphoreum]MCD9477133.1 conjugative transfer relaxase/helicase TraI [Photobacterium phosphoreum]MCF2177990.1 conjugative transfer relaxase/helicase TraI [Photobacterium phosphoreum]
MLSLSPLRASASGASNYYLEEEKQFHLNQTEFTFSPESTPSPDNTLTPTDNPTVHYYLAEKGNSEKTTEWYGKIAEKEGILNQPIDHDKLEAVLNGKLDNHSVKGAGSEDRRTGYDLVFSAPKGASLLALVYGDTRIIDAHNAAIKTALNALETDTAQYRNIDPSTRKADFVNSQNLLFGLVQHKTSREDEPQLHTHALLANMTFDQQDGLKNLASSTVKNGFETQGTFERVLENQKYYGMTYQSELGRALETMGYTIQSLGNGQIDVAGIPENVIEANSTRRQQILSQEKALGLQSGKSRDNIAHQTRKAKTYTPEQSLQKEWQQKNEQLGFDGLAFIAASYRNEHQNVPLSNAPSPLTNAIDNSISYLSERNTALSYEKIITTALDKFAPQGVVNFNETKAQLDSRIKDNHLIALDKDQRIFTTQALIDKEKALIEATHKRTHGLESKADATALQQTGLNIEGRKMVADLLASKKQFNVINLRGSSEQLSSALLHVTENSGYPIHFVTPNKQTQHQTEQHVKRQAFSVNQWVKNAFRPDAVHTTYQYLNNPKTAAQTQNSLIVVEHAHKLGLSDTERIVNQAKAQNNKVIFLNHTQRNQGLRAGNSMETLQKGNTLSMQWQGTQHTDTALHVSEVDKSQRHQFIAEQYHQRSPQERQQIQVLATNKADSEQLNKTIRHQLDITGQLGEKRVEIPVLNPVYLSPEQLTSAQYFKKGMVLTQINQGEAKQYNVNDVSRQNNTLMLSDREGKQRALNLSHHVAPFFVSQPSTLEVAVGERLRINQDVFKTELKANDTLSVEKIGWLGVSLRGDDGKGHIVPLSTLKNSDLSYGYATTLNHGAMGKTTTLVDMQSYTASKETLFDLMQQESKTLHIFTDNHDKLESRMDKSMIQPSSMARVMASTAQLDKYINHQTHEVLYQDVQAGITSLLAQQAPKPLIDQAVNYALSHVSEQQAGFKHAYLVMSAINFAMNEKGTTLLESEINDKLVVLKQQDTLFSAQFHDGTRWTTREAVETERRILQRLSDGKGGVTPFATEKQANHYLGEQTWLTEGQKAGVKLMSTTQDQYTMIQGFAGVGKSTLLEQGKLLIEQTLTLQGNDKIDILGLAPTHAAVNELRDKGIPAQTTQSLLKDIQTGDSTSDKYKNTVFLLDESSMASNIQFDTFTALVEQSGARVTFLGDIYQLQSKEAGKPFELAYRSQLIDTVVMKDIKRQQTPELLSAVKQVINQHPQSTLDAIKSQAPLGSEHYSQPSNQTHNLISTYQATGDSVKDRKVAREQLYDLAATEYLSRTPQSRDNTLMIAYSNRERDLLAGLIRHGLKEMGDLPNQDDVSITRLRGIGATQAELKTMMPYQKGLIINTGKETYLEIQHIDRQYGVLQVKDMTTGKDSQFIPAKHDHKMTTLWSQSQQSLTTGDKITWRKTDKALGLIGNSDLTVSSINKNSMTLQNPTGEKVTLDVNDMKSSHWDYRYTKTADMAQGSTIGHVISVIDSSAPLTNLRRAYIDISRASQHAMIFTDNEKGLMKSWLNHVDNKHSAIETINKTHYPNERHFNTQDSPQENPKYQQQGQFSLSLYSKDLAQQLTPYTESLAIELLGQPNNSKSDKDYLAFGKGQSHTKVSLTGEYRGYFRDWSTGNKGNAINLIMTSQTLTFKEAVNVAEQMVSNPDSFNLVANNKHEQLTNTLPQQVSELKERAINYFNSGEAIKDTPASVYLNNQTFHDIESHSQLRYHDAVYSSETKSTHPALLASLTNNKGEIEAIEITYLTKDGDIANIETTKRLMGNKSGNGMVLNEGTEPNISVIAIGLENGVALMGVNNHDVDIVAVNNAHDLRVLDTIPLREQIIIMANDSQLSNQALIDDITQTLVGQGHHISIIKEALDGLLPNEVSVIISDKVNDGIKELKGENEHNTTQIDQLAKEISEPIEINVNVINSTSTLLGHNDVSTAAEIENSTVDNALSQYELSQTLIDKAAEQERQLEKELDINSPSL